MSCHSALPPVVSPSHYHKSCPRRCAATHRAATTALRPVVLQRTAGRCVVVAAVCRIATVAVPPIAPPSCLLPIVLPWRCGCRHVTVMQMWLAVVHRESEVPKKKGDLPSQLQVMLQRKAARCVNIMLLPIMLWLHGRRCHGRRCSCGPWAAVAVAVTCFLLLLLVLPSCRHCRWCQHMEEVSTVVRHHTEPDE